MLDIMEYYWYVSSSERYNKLIKDAAVFIDGMLWRYMSRGGAFTIGKHF